MLPVLTLLGTGFWMLMIFDCVRNDPEKGTWLWILIFLNVPGAFIYFLVRRAPYLNLPMPKALKQWTQRDKIWDAEAAARNIGNAHQFVNLGNLLLEMGQTERATHAYEQALSKEPQNTHARWGLATIDLTAKRYAPAKERLEMLVKQEPDYKFGAASLAYGQALFELRQWELAQPHLIDDIKRWSHPEAAIMLAEIQRDQGDRSAAKTTLETMIFKLKGTPRFYYRQKQYLLRQAQRMLRTL